VVQESSKQPSHAGLRCWNCGGQQFREIYTRAAAAGKIVRRRACRGCGTRITTWERMIGGRS
jgi:transcriptional regulator NrdR family protein